MKDVRGRRTGIVNICVVIASILVFALFSGCGSDSPTSTERNETTTIIATIEKGNLGISDDGWREINIAYEQAHLSYVQAVIAISSMLYIDPDNTTYEDFQQRWQMVEAALDAMEISGQALDALVAPHEAIAEKAAVTDAANAKEPIVCGENTIEVIKRLGRIARENPEKADQARRALMKLGAIGQAEYESARKEGELHNKLYNYASNIKAGAKLGLFVVGTIATGGSSSAMVANISAVANTVSFGDALFTYANEQQDIHFGAVKVKFGLPEPISRGASILGILSGSLGEAPANVFINFADDIAGYVNNSLDFDVDRDNGKVTVTVSNAPTDAGDKDKPVMPPVVPGYYLKDPGDATLPQVVTAPTVETKAMIEEIEAKLGTDLKAGIQQFQELTTYDLSLSPATVTSDAGESIVFSVVASGTVPGGSTYRWDFGEGSDEALTTTLSTAHTFSTAGDYTVTVRLIDGTTGRVAGMTTALVKVEEASAYAITISPSSATAEVASAVSYIATVTGTPPEGVSYEWTFGDGSSPIGGNWNGTVSKTYSEAGTYTVKVQLKSADGKVLAEDTADAVITNPADSTVTSYLHTMKSVSVYFTAAYEGSDGTNSRTIVIDTRDYSADMVWDGLSFSIQYNDGTNYGTINGKFADEKYKLATLDAVVHEVSSFTEYYDGWPIGTRTWEYDKDILIEDLPVDKYSQYGTNGLTKTIKGSNVQNYIGTVKFTENEPDDKETDPVTFSTVDWSNKDDMPELRIYFFDN